MVKVMLMQGRMTPEQYICDLFDCVNRDGSLYIARYEDGFLRGTATDFSLTTYFEKFKMNCKAADGAKILEKGKALSENLQKIAAKKASEIADGKEAERVLGKGLFRIWDIYVRRFRYNGARARNVEKLIHTDAYVTYRKGDGQFSAEEEALLDRYEEEKKREFCKRLGGGVCAYEVVLRAMRLEKLFELDAPPLILDNERRDLWESLALNGYAKTREKILVKGNAERF